MVPISGMDVFSGLAGLESGFSDPLPEEPMQLLASWIEEARLARAVPNPDAMVLATVDSAGQPAARVVLCKQVEEDEGYLVFYTNYDSRKADDLTRSPSAAATFHWDQAGRQARVRGVVVLSPEEESDAYFATRPVLSQLGAWASRQSEKLRTREELIAQIAETMERFGIDIERVMRSSQGEPDDAEAVQIPRPPNWGGYRLWVRSVELWLGGPGRLHERVQWERELGMVRGYPNSTQSSSAKCAMITGDWRSSRLQP